jgi:hypothetical protein
MVRRASRLSICVVGSVGGGGMGTDSPQSIGIKGQYLFPLNPASANNSPQPWRQVSSAVKPSKDIEGGKEDPLGLDQLSPPASPQKTLTYTPDGGIPRMKMGYIRKQGHKRKNWKKRFFVLDNGVLTYYEKDSKEVPYGRNMKGFVSLRMGMTCTEDAVLNIISIGRGGEEQDGGAANIVLEIPSFTERGAWVLAIKDHITYDFLCNEVCENLDFEK